MFRLPCIHPHLFFIFCIFIAAIFLLSDITNIVNKEKILLVYAHIFTDKQDAAVTNNIGKYQIIFLPFPNNILVNDNSTKLNFSLMENKTDVYNVFVSLIIKNRDSGNIVAQIPYKFYEFGDITFPYTFQNIGDYIVTFQARINGDPNYKVNPLKANFDISVMSSEIPFIAWITYLTPILAAIVGIVIYMDFSMRKRNNDTRDATNQKEKNFDGLS
jgi:hypothetical protein